MAAYVSVPRDLTRVKPKVFFNLTKRQLVCFGGGALMGVPAFFALKQAMPVSLAVVCMMVIMLPLFFLGMYEKDGYPAEAIARQFIQAKLVRPRERPYRTDNYYSALLRQEQAEKEVMQIVSKARQKKGGREGRGAGRMSVKA